MTEPADPTDRIKPVDYDVARVAHAEALHPDPMLLTLIHLANDPGGLRLWIYLLVDGTVIYGRLGADDFAAQVLDDSLRNIVTKARAAAPPDPAGRAGWDHLLEQLRPGLFQTKEKEERSAAAEVRAEILDHADDDRFRFDELPSQLARDALRHENQEAFTLIDAQLKTPSGDTYNVGLIRLRTTDVSSWWVDPAQQPVT